MKNPFRKHTSFGKSGSMEKFSRDSNISLSFADVNATHLSLGLRISKKLRGKDINETLLFFKGLSVENINSAWPRLKVQGNASYQGMK